MIDTMVIKLKGFIATLFRPANLKPKRVHGREITVREFLVFVEHYTSIMKSDEIATARATNSVIVNECIEMYRQSLSALIRDDPRDPSSFEELLNTVCRNAVNYFSISGMIGDETEISAALEDVIAGSRPLMSPSRE